MARLTREEILNAKDIQSVEISVPAWGGDVLIRPISALERSRIIKQSTDKDGTLDTGKFQTMAIIAACVEPKFEKADIEALGGKLAGTIAKVAGEIFKASGFTMIEEDDQEEAEKNS